MLLKESGTASVKLSNRADCVLPELIPRSIFSVFLLDDELV
jgi:hypothetical protein